MPNWTAWIAWAVLIVGFLGTATVYLRGSKDKGTIATLESSNQALLEWQGVATKQIEDLKSELSRASLRIDHLEQENTGLRQVRPSAEVLAGIGARLDQHDTSMRQIGEQIVAKLEHLGGSGR